MSPNFGLPSSRLRNNTLQRDDNFLLTKSLIIVHNRSEKTFFCSKLKIQVMLQVVLRDLFGDQPSNSCKNFNFSSKSVRLSQNAASRTHTSAPKILCTSPCILEPPSNILCTPSNIPGPGGEGGGGPQSTAQTIYAYYACTSTAWCSRRVGSTEH